MASVLAMLFLVLFSTLAVGFVATTTSSSQIASNEQSIQVARAGAETGMQFIRYQLDQITIPAGTTQSGLMDAVATQLGGQMNATSNMQGHIVSNLNGTIVLPAASVWMPIDSITGAQCNITITQSAMNLVVTVKGSRSSTSVQKSIQLQYGPAQVSGTIFNFGIASKGEMVMSSPVTVTGATDPTRGSVLIATAGSTPLSNSGNGTAFSGDLSYTNASGANSYGNMTVDGYNSSSPSFPQHVHKGVTPPQFPTVDSSVFLPYCTGNTYSGSQSASNPPPFVNSILPANGNYNFSGNVTIQGVLYIMQPNKISFSGPVTIQGAIVVDTTNPPSGTSATNSIKFSQTVSATGMPNTVPAAEQALTGSVILAPNFSVTATNSFGTVSGSMVAGTWQFTNTFTATVNGSIIQLDDSPMKFTNTANITIDSVGANYLPAGITFGTKYIPSAGSYLEL